MQPHILFVAGEDADLRLPFILAVREQGFRVSVAASGGADAFARSGIAFVPFAFDRFISPVSDVRAIRRLGDILDRLKPDLAQGFDTKPCLMLPLAAARRDIAAIRTICGRGWVYSSRSPAALVARGCYRLLHGVAAQHAAATVFQTRSDQRFFQAHHMEGRSPTLIPAGGGGIDPARFEAALAQAPDPADLRRELGLGDAEVVLTVSRVTRQKGIGTLLEAIDRVGRVRPKVRFLLVGPRDTEGALAADGASIAARSPQLLATGPRKDIPALMKMADVFAFPTAYSEGVPRVLLEAGLARLPIVSTSMPGCLDVIEDGRTGRLVAPNDATGLAERIVEALADREASAEMAARLPRKVRANFSVAAGAARHAALYRALLAEDAPAQRLRPAISARSAISR